MKTYTELQNICLRRTKTEGEADALAGFQEDLNIGQSIIASLRLWSELYTSSTLSLTNGVETYSLASDVDVVEQLRITSPTDQEKELKYISKEEFRRINPVTSNDSTAVPTYWYWSEPSIGTDYTPTKQVSFYPIPDGGYTVEYSYKKTVPQMSNVTDYPFFDGKYHHILTYYAIWKYAEREADQSLNPTYWKNEWETALGNLIETDSQQKHQPPIGYECP